MAGTSSRTSPATPRLRISDADRHQVAELLREAAGEGRLDLEELDERLEAAYAAKTYADLVPITLDLPIAGAHPAPHRPRYRARAARRRAGRALRLVDRDPGRVSRKGAWQVGPTHTAFAVMGGLDIDLREARSPAGRR